MKYLELKREEARKVVGGEIQACFEISIENLVDIVTNPVLVGGSGVAVRIVDPAILVGAHAGGDNTICAPLGLF